jgi:glycosyltransferase involved in cell wall biosynthesis
MYSYDVTVSVWNDFWAPELCSGLCRAGFSVLALRSEWKPLAGASTQCSYASGLLTRIFQRTQRQELLEAAENRFEAFARHRTGRSPVFWGWSDHNLTAFQSALRKGQRVICERGSTHGTWAAERLEKVHRDLGWGPANLQTSPRIARANEEYHLAEKIVVPSMFVKKTFLEKGFPESQLHVNPYGVDRALWGSVAGSERQRGPLIFVFAASLGPRKGAHVLLRAWEKANLQDSELWLCGGIHMPLEQLQLPLGKSVKILGRRTHDSLAAIYNKASFYVLPSFEEGMARSGIEALAAGLPVIVTEETGLTDLMTTGKEGWIVESGNVEHLAETLRAVSRARHEFPVHSAAARACTTTSDKTDYGDRAAGFLRALLAKGR